MEQVILTVPDISCGHCEHTVKSALTPVEGVRQVTVSIPTHQVRVEFDPSKVSVETMSELLRAEDYPVASVAPVNG